MQRLENERSIDQLIDAILTRSDNVPNFALLLGSGASVTSYVKTASEMINDWRMRIYKRSGATENFKDWLSKQDWYESDDEYALLFERMYDQAPLRRAYIEDCLKDAHPSWGYVYLVNLLRQNIFNVVFITNFDDLINEACFLYSDLRPIVCAFDSAVSGIRVTSARPKIIKLHGDFLFDNIKNTKRELETLENNMKRKFVQFAQEYGLVVVGYSGRDRSVMDILDLLVKQEEYFKQGIYWCEWIGEEKRGRRLSSLLRRDNIYLVKIPGFDEFMAEIHNKADLTLPKSWVDPLWVVRERARLFINVPDSVRGSKIISRDIKRVLQGVNNIMALDKVLCKLKGAEETYELQLEERLPSSLRAAAVRQQRDLESALQHIKKAHEEDPEDINIAYEMAEILARLRRKDKLKRFILSEQCPIDDENKTYYLLHAHGNEDVIAMADKILSSQPSSYLARINRAIALKRLGSIKEMEKELLILESGGHRENVRAGIAALRGKKKEMLSLIEKALDKGLFTIDIVEMYVVFEDYWEDKDFLKLLERRKGIRTE